MQQKKLGVYFRNKLLPDWCKGAYSDMQRKTGRSRKPIRRNFFSKINNFENFLHILKCTYRNSYVLWVHIRKCTHVWLAKEKFRKSPKLCIFLKHFGKIRVSFQTFPIFVSIFRKFACYLLLDKRIFGKRVINNYWEPFSYPGFRLCSSQVYLFLGGCTPKCIFGYAATIHKWYSNVFSWCTNIH